MGWGLGVAGGFSEAEVARKGRQKEQLFVEEQNMINTMLPLAIENRKQRQIDRKKYKEQYSVLTSIVSPDVAQDIIRKGDLFTQNFITKVGEMENELGRKVTEADLIESGAVTRGKQEYFPMGMRTVDTVQDVAKRTGPLGGGEVVGTIKGSERVRAAPVSIGYKQIGASFDQFMREIMGEFKNTNINTNKLRDDMILNFGKIPGHEKALVHSAYRKIAAQMGISPNEVASLASGEYDYTDVTAEGYGVDSEDYKTTVKMPFVKGKEFYSIRTARMDYERSQLADTIRLPVTLPDGKEVQLPLHLATPYMTYLEKDAALKLWLKQRIQTDDQKSAEQDMFRVINIQNKEIARMLGGKYSTDDSGNYSFFFGKTPSAETLATIAFDASQRARASYSVAVAENFQGDTNFYIKEAGLDSATGLRMHILNAAHFLTGPDDPNRKTHGMGTYVRMLTEINSEGNQYTPPESNPYYNTVGKIAFPKQGIVQFSNTLTKIMDQDGFTDTPVAKFRTRETSKAPKKWDDEYEWLFNAFEKEYKLHPRADENRGSIALSYQNKVIDQIKEHKGIVTKDYDDDITEYLNFTEILEEDIPIYGTAERTKLGVMEERVAGLDEFIDGLMPVTDTETDDTPTVDAATAAATRKAEEEATRKAEEEATRKAEEEARKKVVADQHVITDPVSKRPGRWSGELKDGDPVGVGTMTLEDDGITMSGEYDQKGEEVGPWVITNLKTGDEETRYFPMTENALDNIDQKYEEIDRFIGFTIRPFRDSDKHKGVKETIINLGAELRDSYDEYKIGRLSTEDFTNKMKELGLAVDKAVEEVWVDDIHNKFKLASLGGGLHKEYLGDLAKFKKEFNIN